LLTALADAMFVLASGTVEEHRAEPGPPGDVLTLEPGAEAEGLLAEASRRIRVLASSPFPVIDRRERLIAAPGAVRPDVQLGAGQDEILALADRMRTTRNLAFALGRGVYATTLQLARMHEAGQLVAASRSARQAGHPAASAELEPGDRLPRRSKGCPGGPRRHAGPMKCGSVGPAAIAFWPGQQSRPAAIAIQG